MKKKKIIILLLVIILYNFIACNISNAFVGLDSINVDSITAGGMKDLVNEGIANGTPLPFKLMSLVGQVAAVVICMFINLFPIMIQVAMSVLTGEFPLTIESIVFNEVEIFNINFFDFGSKGDFLYPVKMSVAKWFVILRLLALSINLVILIYVGIRMALSTVASDKTRYKKMLVGWLESMVILFTLQYLMSFLFAMGEVFSDILINMRDAFGGKSFEKGLYNDLITKVTTTDGTGWSIVINCLSYWLLIFIETKYFLTYFKRVVTVGFLVLISPLITVTFSLDKLKDNKAQAFSVWLNEIMVNIFIQPVHAMIYLVFMYTAGEIAEHSKIIALLFLLSLTKVEKIILQLFNLRNVVSLKPIEDEIKSKE